MTNSGHMISVPMEDQVRSFDNDRGPYHLKTTAYYWAVRTPQNFYTSVTDEVESRPRPLGAPEYRIFGSSDVVVYNRATIRGLRLLLDAIEKELDEKEDTE